MPTVLPSGSLAGCHPVFHLPCRPFFSANEKFLKQLMVRKAPTVAVASSTAPGVWETSIPRAVAAAMSTRRSVLYYKLRVGCCVPRLGLRLRSGMRMRMRRKVWRWEKSEDRRRSEIQIGRSTDVENKHWTHSDHIQLHYDRYT